MNEQYILKCMEPYLNNNREISEFEFFELFSDLTQKEQYEIINIMIKNDIEYVDEKEEESEKLSSIKNLINEDIGDLKKLLHLTNEQLCIMAQNGDKLALSTLVKKNERFIYKLAIKLSGQYRKNCLSIDDLYQTGNMGLLEAVNKFDISKDFKFLTYCWHWVRQKIERSIIDEGYMIRIPVHMFEKIIKIYNYQRKNNLVTLEELIEIILINENKEGRTITIDEIKRCIFLGENLMNTTSLNTLVGEDNDSELMGFIINENEESVEDLVIRDDLENKIDFILHTLTKREEDILRYRFGFKTDEPLTLEEVGKIYNVTRERIRQIEAKALRKLRHSSRSKKIASFY